MKSILETACYQVVFQDVYIRRSWTFSSLNASTTFHFNHSKILTWQTVGYLPHSKRVPSKLICFYSERRRIDSFEWLLQYQLPEARSKRCERTPFCKYSQGNTERLVSDANNHEPSPFSLNVYCSDSINLGQSQLVISIHCLFILIPVIFFISFLTFCEAYNRFASGELAFLSACFGSILPTLRQWLNA